MSDLKNLTVEKSDRIAIVTLNRPEVLNALNASVMAEVARVFAELDRDPDVAVSILTGEGKAFAAGADIKELGFLE